MTAGGQKGGLHRRPRHGEREAVARHAPMRLTHQWCTVTLRHRAHSSARVAQRLRPSSCQSAARARPAGVWPCAVRCCYGRYGSLRLTIKGGIINRRSVSHGWLFNVPAALRSSDFCCLAHHPSGAMLLTAVAAAAIAAAPPPGLMPPTNPPWQPTYNLGRSTITMTCNSSGWSSPERGAGFGIVRDDYRGAVGE